MGPDEHVSREEFLNVIDYLLAVVAHQQKASQLMLRALGESGSLTASHFSHLSDELALRQSTSVGLRLSSVLTSFEEIRKVVEQIKIVRTHKTSQPIERFLPFQIHQRTFRPLPKGG